MAAESDLYEPVKVLLEGLGYEVKAEVKDCDVVAVREGAATIVVELKLTFSLDLVLQGVDRLKFCDNVYLAVPAPDTPIKRRNWRSRQQDLKRLCRMLSLGLILVSPEAKSGRQAEILLDPGPYAPRKTKRPLANLLSEFASREGDPNKGGVTGVKIMTAYRQDALRCARFLGEVGQAKVSVIKTETEVGRAASILQNNHYGWFERAERGIYQLSSTGREALDLYADMVDSLSA